MPNGAMRGAAAIAKFDLFRKGVFVMAGINAGPLMPPDENAIRDVLTGYMDTWNRHECSAMADLFAPDAEWVNIVGMHWRGAEAVIRAHEAFHRAMFREMTLRMESAQLRAIAEGVAAAVVTIRAGAFTPPDGVPRPAARNRLSFILAKRGGQWRIVQGHNTVVDEKAAPFDPVNGDQKGERQGRS